MSLVSKIASKPILFYLKYAAKLQLLKHASNIIGITGSAGKSSTRNAIVAVLQNSKNLKVSYKANSESGIPLNILELSPNNYSIFDWLRLLVRIPITLVTTWPKHEVYVVEMGIDSPKSPKNMGYLLSIVKPSIGVFLNVAPVHAQNFDYLVHATNNDEREKQIKQLIANEKGRLITALPKDGVAVLNGDDALVREFATQTNARVVTFGSQNTNTVWFDQVKQTLDGTSIRFHFQNQSATLHLKSYLLPKHFASTFAAAIAIGLNFGQSLSESVEHLKNNFALPPGRSSLLPGIKGSILLDSSYNASTQPTIEALELIASLNPGHSMAILGDLREVGRLSKSQHLKVAAACLKTTQFIFLVGNDMKKYVLPYLQKHGHQVSWHETALSAAKACEQKLSVGDVVLIKGSQNTLFLETAVTHLLRHKHTAHKVLCRQSKFWDNVRNNR